MQPEDWFAKLQRQAIQAVVVVIGLSVGASIVGAMLAPITPLLLSVAALAIIYRFVFERWRR